MKEVRLLTTVDNPYDPIEEFEEWYAFDIANGYHTLDLLGRVLLTAPTLSPPDQEDARQQAIDEIIRENVSGMHRIVYASESD